MSPHDTCPTNQSPAGSSTFTLIDQGILFKLIICIIRSIFRGRVYSLGYNASLMKISRICSTFNCREFNSLVVCACHIPLLHFFWHPRKFSTFYFHSIFEINLIPLSQELFNKVQNLLTVLVQFHLKLNWRNTANWFQITRIYSLYTIFFLWNHLHYPQFPTSSLRRLRDIIYFII